MWLKKQASVPTERRQGAGTDPITTPSATTDATVSDATDTSLRPESILMRSEVEAVEWLRMRSYIIALPYASPDSP